MPACFSMFSRVLALPVCLFVMAGVVFAQPMIPVPESELLQLTPQVADETSELSGETFVLEPQLEPIQSDDPYSPDVLLNDLDGTLDLFQPQNTAPGVEGLTLGLPENVQPPVAARGSDWVGRSRFIRSHWVRLTPGGDLLGKISLLNANGGSRGAESLEVKLYRNSKLVARTMTDEIGKFRLQNVPSGVYSLIARGNSGFVAYGLHALRSREGTSQSKQSQVIQLVQAVEVGETLEISSAAVPPTFRQVGGILKENFHRIRTRYVPESAYTSLIQEAAKHKTEGWDQPEGPEEFRGLRGLESKGTRSDRTRASTALQSHDVVLEPARRGWVIRGRLFGIDPDSGRSVEVEAESTEVTLIQDDKRVAVDTVKAEGEFDFYGVDEGVYSIVAIGEGGFGAIAFRAVRPSNDGDARRGKSSSIRLVQLDDRDRDAVGGDEDGLGGGQPAGMAIGNAPGGGGGGGGLSIAMISDAAAIRDAVGGGAGGGGEGLAAAAGSQGVPLVSPPADAPYQVVGDTVLPADGFGDFSSSMMPPPPPPQGGGFTSTSGSGGNGFLGSGGLLGVAGGVAAIIALTDDDDASQRLVTPFEP